MVLNYIWIAFFVVAFVFGLAELVFMGNTTVFADMVQATFDSSKTAFETALGLTGVLALWLGIMKIGERAGVVNVLARMLSPAMLGIVVENRYDGVLKRQGGILHSTKHEGQGVGLVSIQTAVRKYNGDLTVETQNNVFRANVLLNL